MKVEVTKPPTPAPTPENIFKQLVEVTRQLRLMNVTLQFMLHNGTPLTDPVAAREWLAAIAEQEG